MEDDTRPQHGATSIRKDGDALAEQLNQTTSPDAGGNVSGTGDQDAPDSPSNLDILFEAEEHEHGGR